MSDGIARGRGGETLAAAVVVLALVVGLPALLFVLAGQALAAVGLVALFLVMVLVSAYALRVVVRERTKGDD